MRITDLHLIIGCDVLEFLFCKILCVCAYVVQLLFDGYVCGLQYQTKCEGLPTHLIGLLIHILTVFYIYIY